MATTTGLPRSVVVLVLALACIPAAAAALRYGHGLALVMRAADRHGILRRLADFDALPVRERQLRIPDDGEPGSWLRARVYAPATRARHTVVLVPGLHPDGIDEARFVPLARTLAEAGLTVVTPELPELSRFEITPDLTSRIELATQWIAAQPDLAPVGRVGLMGISVSGGLAIVVAGRPALRDRLLYVFSFGGHDDFRRLIEYYCSGCPGVPPHDFGVTVALSNVVARLVPTEQVDPLRTAIRRFLVASYLDRTDRARAEREYADLRALVATLPEPTATILGYVNNRDVRALGQLLQPHISPYADHPDLSPAKSPAPTAPVFLLHGRDDTVIPASESQRLADRLRGRVPVHLLLTDLISHADPDQPAHVMDVARLARFWGDLLAQDDDR